jgi:hypothetical protein
VIRWRVGVLLSDPVGILVRVSTSTAPVVTSAVTPQRLPDGFESLPPGP